MDRPETIDETVALIQRAGGRAVAMRVDHTCEEEVACLAARVRNDEGRLDVLVNSIWGGDPLIDWGRRFWEIDLARVHATLDQTLISHVITNRHLAPLMVETNRGLIVEVIDGHFAGYRGHILYDLVKASLARLAYGMAMELAQTGVTALSLSPGFLRSEAVLEHFGVCEDNWRASQNRSLPPLSAVRLWSWPTIRTFAERRGSFTLPRTLRASTALPTSMAGCLIFRRCSMRKSRRSRRRRRWTRSGASSCGRAIVRSTRTLRVESSPCCSGRRSVSKVSVRVWRRHGVIMRADRESARDPMGLGFRALRGGAVVVGVAVDGGEPRVVLSTFLATAAEGDRLALEPYHVAAEMERGPHGGASAEEAAAVAEGRERQSQLAAKGLDDIFRKLQEARCAPVVAALLANRVGWITDLLEYSLSWPEHPRVAEGLAVRETLRFALGQCGIEIVEVDEKTLHQLASEKLHKSSADIATRLNALGSSVGRPWRKEQKLACFAAWVTVVAPRGGEARQP